MLYLVFTYAPWGGVYSDAQTREVELTTTHRLFVLLLLPCTLQVMMLANVLMAGGYSEIYDDEE